MSESMTAEVARVFGANLRRIREARGWSQSELARQMQEAGWPKYSQVAVSRTEEGTRSVRLDEAIALARLLERTVQDLLDPKVVVDAWAQLRQAMEELSWSVTTLRNAASEFDLNRCALQLLRANLDGVIKERGGPDQVSEVMTRTLANADKMLTLTAHDIVDQVDVDEDPDDVRDLKGDR